MESRPRRRGCEAKRGARWSPGALSLRWALLLLLPLLPPLPLLLRVLPCTGLRRGLLSPLSPPLLSHSQRRATEAPRAALAPPAPVRAAAEAAEAAEASPGQQPRVMVGLWKRCTQPLPQAWSPPLAPLGAPRSRRHRTSWGRTPGPLRSPEPRIRSVAAAPARCQLVLPRGGAPQGPPSEPPPR